MLCYKSAIANDGKVLYPIAHIWKNGDDSETLCASGTATPHRKNGITIGKHTKLGASFDIIKEHATMIFDNGDLPLDAIRIALSENPMGGGGIPLKQFHTNISTHMPTYVMSATDIIKRHGADERLCELDPLIQQTLLNLVTWWAISVVDCMVNKAMSKSAAIQFVNKTITGPLFDFKISQKIGKNIGFFLFQVTTNELGNLSASKYPDDGPAPRKDDTIKKLFVTLTKFPLWNQKFAWGAAELSNNTIELLKACGSMYTVNRPKATITFESGRRSIDITKYVQPTK